MASVASSPYRSAAEVGRALRAGELTARSVTENALARIDALEPRLNAFRVVLHEEALAAAAAAQERLDAGEEAPLLGIPVAVKDNVDLAGQTTQFGTGARREPARADAELVARLRRAGAVIVGKTHLPELAIFPFTDSKTHGITRNPWDPDRTTGGSSGGAGAAVAAGMVPLAHATDGGGSIRLPAAFCGLFGLKPTRDLVSLGPDLEHWHGLSVANCVSRTVLDGALFLDVVADDPHPSYAAAAGREPGRLRVVWTVKPPVPGPVAKDAKAAVRETAELLATLGHAVSERAPTWGVLLPAFLPRWVRGIRDDGRALGDPAALERRTRQLMAAGRPFSDARVARARERGERAAERIGRLWGSFDVLITPTVPHAAERAGKWQGRSALRTTNRAAVTAAFTTPWNVTGQPAASVPAGFDAAGMPRSVQLVGRRGAEETLISLAAQLESARPWAQEEPPLHV